MLCPRSLALSFSVTGPEQRDWFTTALGSGTPLRIAWQGHSRLTGRRGRFAAEARTAPPHTHAQTRQMHKKESAFRRVRHRSMVLPSLECCRLCTIWCVSVYRVGRTLASTVQRSSCRSLYLRFAWSSTRRRSLCRVLKGQGPQVLCHEAMLVTTVPRQFVVLVGLLGSASALLVERDGPRLPAPVGGGGAGGMSSESDNPFSLPRRHTHALHDPFEKPRLVWAGLHLMIPVVLAGWVGGGRLARSASSAGR